MQSSMFAGRGLVWTGFARGVALVLGMWLAVGSVVQAQTTYYWDYNGSTAGFGAAGGTWAAPTPGGATGWSTDSTGKRYGN